MRPASQRFHEVRDLRTALLIYSATEQAPAVKVRDQLRELGWDVGITPVVLPPRTRHEEACSFPRDPECTPCTCQKVYEGRRESNGFASSLLSKVVVKVNGRDLPTRRDVKDLSPTGFEWGYGGSGPAQLALAILCDYWGDEVSALRYHQEFKWEVVALLPEGNWTLTEAEIEQAVRKVTGQLREKEAVHG